MARRKQQQQYLRQEELEWWHGHYDHNLLASVGIQAVPSGLSCDNLRRLLWSTSYQQWNESSYCTQQRKLVDER